MKIALVGATGNIGRQIARHALAHGHQVTAVVRSEKDLPAELAGAQLAIAALDDTAALAAVIAGHDVLASAYGPRPGDDIGQIASVADQLVAAARQAKVPRVVVVGGAGSLEIAPGHRVVDLPDFPAAYKAEATKGAEFLDLLEHETQLDWTFLSPSAEFVPGERTGKFRIGKDNLLSNEDGSRISFEDYAIALVDEIEKPQHSRQRFTVGY